MKLLIATLHGPARCLEDGKTLLRPDTRQVMTKTLIGSYCLFWRLLVCCILIPLRQRGVHEADVLRGLQSIRMSSQIFHPGGHKTITVR